MKVLSLFDGMACGMLAMMAAGGEVESYDAYEIDKYAVKTATHNFPMIEQHGDVFKEDFTKYDGVDFLVGGSPCTYWSIAQTKNRETVASGMGWELFSQYVRALHEAKPKYFIYENNKSMSKEIRASIDKAFGFEAVCINSALVSAQNRQRLYWVGKRNADGTYSKVSVEQPEDRGILLKDVLDGAVAWKEKAYTLDASYWKTTGQYNPENQCARRLMAAEPVAGRVVGRRINEQGRRDDYNEDIPIRQRFEANDNQQKTNCLTTVEKDNRIAEPVCCTEPRGAARRGEHERNQCWEIRGDEKSNAVITGHQSRLVAEPVNANEDGKAFCVTSRYYKGFGENPGRCIEKHRDSIAAEPVNVNSNGKANTIRASDGAHMGTRNIVASKNDKRTGVAEPLCYAAPCEWDENGEPTKAVSCSDGKVYPVYKVENGEITIKDKQYPIKLVDGYYIIRKLTVSECMRLQTVPEWYDFSCVSNSQAYKMLGNGWTVEVIAHLIRSALCGGQDGEEKNAI